MRTSIDLKSCCYGILLRAPFLTGAIFFLLVLLFKPGVNSEAFAEAPNGGTPVHVRIGNHGVSPDRVELSSGSTVVWVNDTGASVRVRFLAQTVSTTCNAPHGFVISAAGIAVSQLVPRGGVLSLCLLEPRNYRYEVDLIDVDVARGPGAVPASVTNRAVSGRLLGMVSVY